MGEGRYLATSAQKLVKRVLDIGKNKGVMIGLHLENEKNEKLERRCQKKSKAKSLRLKERHEREHSEIQKEVRKDLCTD